MKLKSIFIALMCMAVPACAFANTNDNAGDGDNTRVTRTLRARPFNEISVNAGIKVIYTTGKLADFKAEGTRSALDKLDCRVEEGELEIDIKPRCRGIRGGEIVLYITAPAVREISVNGGSNLVVKNAYAVSGDLEIEVNGGAGFTALSTVSAERRLSVSSNGGARLRIDTGLKALAIEIESNGGARLDISSIEAKAVEIDSNGGALAEISGVKTQALEVTSNGGAGVNVKEIETAMLEVDANGGARATVSGHTGYAELSANGASRINAKGLTSDHQPEISSHVASSVSYGN